jgi:Protein of unknown function (DUF2786)
MSTRAARIRKLRALARSPNRHEAALAKAKAQELDSRTAAKEVARAIARLLEERGLTVHMKRRAGSQRARPKVDAVVNYFVSRHRPDEGSPQLNIEIVEYPETRPLPSRAEAARAARAFEEWLKRRHSSARGPKEGQADCG